MNETHPCERECRLSCTEVCAAHPPGGPVLFRDALALFGREAAHGTLDTGRYRMPYFTWGEGPPLLFIHGVSDSSRSFLLPIARLSGHFRCIAYDLPSGRGDGARLRRYTHADLAADLWALLDHLRVGQSYVLATSFGATIALAALRERPARLPRAVLQGAFARRPLRRAEWLLARMTRFLPGPMSRVPFRRQILQAINHGAFVGQPHEVWENFLESSGRAPIASFAYQALMLHRLDLRPLLPHIRQPVLLVHGERDTVVPWAHAEELLQGLPNARCAVLEGCGHVPNYTHPEVLAEVVRQALTPPDAGATKNLTRG